MRKLRRASLPRRFWWIDECLLGHGKRAAQTEFALGGAAPRHAGPAWMHGRSGRIATLPLTQFANGGEIVLDITLLWSEIRRLMAVWGL